MRKRELLVGAVFLAAGAIGIASLLAGGEVAKWGQLVLAVGWLLGGLLQMNLEKRK